MLIELFKIALAKPLHAIVASLCMVVLTLCSGFFEVKQAVAVINEQQKLDAFINTKVLNMSDALIRIDENVKFLKNQTKTESNL